MDWNRHILLTNYTEPTQALGLANFSVRTTTSYDVTAVRSAFELLPFGRPAA